MNLPDRDGRVTLRSTHPVRINPNESAWAPMSTYRFGLTSPDADTMETRSWRVVLPVWTTTRRL